MTNRRSLQTNMQRISRARQFVPGHLGGRVASAQPVRRRAGVGQVSAPPPPPGPTPYACYDLIPFQDPDNGYYEDGDTQMWALELDPSGGDIPFPPGPDEFEHTWTLSITLDESPPDSESVYVWGRTVYGWNAESALLDPPPGGSWGTNPVVNIASFPGYPYATTFYAFAVGWDGPHWGPGVYRRFLVPTSGTFCLYPPT
jgi:hypothetical protein